MKMSVSPLLPTLPSQAMYEPSVVGPGEVKAPSFVTICDALHTPVAGSRVDFRTDLMGAYGLLGFASARSHTRTLPSGDTSGVSSTSPTSLRTTEVADVRSPT